MTNHTESKGRVEGARLEIRRAHKCPSCLRLVRESDAVETPAGWECRTCAHGFSSAEWEPEEWAKALDARGTEAMSPLYLAASLQWLRSEAHLYRDARAVGAGFRDIVELVGPRGFLAFVAEDELDGLRLAVCAARRERLAGGFGVDVEDVS